METVLQKKVAPMKRLPLGPGLSSGLHLAVPSGLKGAEKILVTAGMVTQQTQLLPACPVQSSGSRTKAQCWGLAREERARSAYSGGIWGHLSVGAALGLALCQEHSLPCRWLYLEGTAERAEVTRQDSPLPAQVPV